MQAWSMIKSESSLQICLPKNNCPHLHAHPSKPIALTTKVLESDSPLIFVCRGWLLRLFGLCFCGVLGDRLCRFFRSAHRRDISRTNDPADKSVIYSSVRVVCVATGWLYSRFDLFLTKSPFWTKHYVCEHRYIPFKSFVVEFCFLWYTHIYVHTHTNPQKDFRSEKCFPTSCPLVHWLTSKVDEQSRILWLCGWQLGTWRLRGIVLY